MVRPPPSPRVRENHKSSTGDLRTRPLFQCWSSKDPPKPAEGPGAHTQLWGPPFLADSGREETENSPKGEGGRRAMGRPPRGQEGRGRALGSSYCQLRSDPAPKRCSVGSRHSPATVGTHGLKHSVMTLHHRLCYPLLNHDRSLRGRRVRPPRCARRPTLTGHSRAGAGHTHRTLRGCLGLAEETGASTHQSPFSQATRGQ